MYTIYPSFDEYLDWVDLISYDEEYDPLEGRVSTYPTVLTDKKRIYRLTPPIRDST